MAASFFQRLQKQTFFISEIILKTNLFLERKNQRDIYLEQRALSLSHKETLITSARRLCFHLCVSVCLFVCRQDISGYLLHRFL